MAKISRDDRPTEMISGLPLRLVGGSVRLTVHLTPHARTEGINGIRAGADGRPALSVAVIAPAAENRANEALLQLLARTCRLPRSDLTLVTGHKSRDKVVSIAGEPGAIADRLAALLADAG